MDIHKDIHKDLKAISDIAMAYSLKHNCNYNVIILNPVNGEFDINSSTYEYVIDSYFDKERPNVIVVSKTDDSLQSDLGSRDLYGTTDIGNQYHHTYLDFKTNSRFDDFILSKPNQYTYIRSTPKLSNNDTCHCGSELKYKKCCKK